MPGEAGAITGQTAGEGYVPDDELWEGGNTSQSDIDKAGEEASPTLLLVGKPPAALDGALAHDNHLPERFGPSISLRHRLTSHPCQG